jgi:uncharacterized protein YrzB (UPF0473 family)
LTPVQWRVGLFDKCMTACYGWQVIFPNGGERRFELMSDNTHDHEGDHEHEMDEEVILLEDEDGKEHRFVLGDVITVESKDYAVLLPIDDELEEGVIFRIDGEEGDQMVLADIESDEEWEKVVTAYNEYMDEFDEEDEEDDEEETEN